ncbi:MAG: TetR family transcriptional regulator [Acidobacteria bacterium]|nr:TetR family transcriptional regulator [Acidobacteriota bacterium]
MKGRDARRQALVEQMADHVLSVGLPGASLRPLAAACGTSDRMLLYYFADKNELLSATLGAVAARLTQLLDAALPGVAPYAVLLPRICRLMAAAPMKPYLQLWLELAALASRQQEPYLTIAGQLGDGFLAWTAARLEVSREADRLPTASLLLATVEGTVVLRAIGRETMVAAALGQLPDEEPNPARPRRPRKSR